jgi:hypothetical protein
MATLSNPTFQIDRLTGLPFLNQYLLISGSVNVELSLSDFYLINNLKTPLQLQSTLWGDDGGLNEDDLLFSFPSRRITASGTYSFSKLLPSRVLNEDSSWFDNTDEVYNRFTIPNGFNLVTTNSRTITGKF